MPYKDPEKAKANARERSARWLAKNRDKRNARRRELRDANREEYLAKRRRYYMTVSEKLRAECREYYASNVEIRRIKSKEYRLRADVAARKTEMHDLDVLLRPDRRHKSNRNAEMAT